MEMRLRSLQDVVETDLCVGCGICEAIAGHRNVEMRLNPEGFYRPSVCHAVDSSTWREIRRVCPGIELRQDTSLNPRDNETLWGAVQYAGIGYASDEEMRFRASSGGAISAILVHMLESGRADYVLHTGASESDPFVSSACVSRKREDVVDRSGSRYVPTAPLVNLVDLLDKDDARFAVVGKPCDVAALRSYMKLHREANSRIVALLSFFCAGVPSILATYDLVQRLGLQEEQVRDFRYRGFGWPGRTTATDLSGREHSMSYGESWGDILGKRLQFRCKICPDGIGEFADIVCGDAWTTRDGYPDFEERPGRSLIFARTEHGVDLVKSAAECGHLTLEPFPGFEVLAAMQPYQKRRRQAIIPRLLALQMAGRPIPHYRGFRLWRSALMAGPIFFIRQLGGMLSRVSE